MPVILAAAGIITLIVFFILLLPDKKDASEEIQKMESRLAPLEKEIGEIKNRISSLESLPSENPVMPQDAQQWQAIPMELENIQKQLEHLDKRQGNLERKFAGVAETAVKHTRRTAEAPGRKTNKSVKTGKTAAPVRNARYHVVAEGDTLYSIANRYNISVKDLLRMNGLAEDATIHPEQKLAVSP